MSNNLCKIAKDDLIGMAIDMGLGKGLNLVAMKKTEIVDMIKQASNKEVVVTDSGVKGMPVVDLDTPRQIDNPEELVYNTNHDKCPRCGASVCEVFIEGNSYLNCMSGCCSILKTKM
jgi:hypothetical protein